MQSELRALLSDTMEGGLYQCFSTPFPASVFLGGGGGWFDAHSARIDAHIRAHSRTFGHIRDKAAHSGGCGMHENPRILEAEPC